MNEIKQNPCYIWFKMVDDQPLLVAFTNSKQLSQHLYSLVSAGICCVKERGNNVAHIIPIINICEGQASA